MDNESARLEDRVERLEQIVTELLARTGTAASRESPTPVGGDSGVAVSTQPFAPIETVESSEAAADSNAYLAFVGRTFLVLGGAFLLRAVTDSGQVARGVGVIIGFAYALLWLIAADRGARQQRLSALFHGCAAVIIAFPLVWESATRFELLSPNVAAATVVLLTSLTLGVAARADLAAVATLAMTSALCLAVALLVVTQQFVPLSIALALVGVATLWVGYWRRWPWLAWLPALLADAVVASLVQRTLSGDSSSPPMTVILIQFGLLGAYLGSFALQTRLRQRSVDPFEIVQTAAVTAIGLIGAVLVSHYSEVGVAVVGVGSFALALVSYGAALACRRSGGGYAANFHFYASFGLVCALVGSIAMLPGPVAAIFFAVAALAVAWLAGRLPQATLLFHAFVYAFAMAAASGLLALVGAAFVVAPASEWLAVGLPVWLALLVTGALVVGTRPPRVDASEVTRLSHACVLLLFTLEASAIVVVMLAPSVAGTPANAGVLATLRTVVLAAATLLLAMIRYREPTIVSAWLINLMHGIVGLKLVVDDFRHSEPATLFLALGVFGVALIVTARLVRRPSAPRSSGA